MWVKDCQNVHYSDVRSNLLGLSKGRKRFPIINQLQLFIDEMGIIRCKGQLENAPLTYEAKHPILIPKSCRLALLITRDAHLNVFHFGVNATVAKIRERYWIPQMRQFIKAEVIGV